MFEIRNKFFRSVAVVFMAFSPVLIHNLFFFILFTDSCKTSMTSASHYIQTALHALQLVISYFLMLIVMTYNVWLFLSVVLGCTVGYFLFGWQKGFLFDITEHCH